MMPAACRQDPWSTPAFDPQRSLVQAYTRLILLPARADGSKMAVIARFGTRDVCLVEPWAANAPPEGAPLRVELYDRARGHAVESMACNDLQEAEAATSELIEDAREGAFGCPPARSDQVCADTSGRETIVLQPIPINTGSSDEAGVLALADGRLVALLVRLSGRLHGTQLAGSWFMEAGFGPCAPDGQRVFATLAAAEDWLRARLVEKE
jgi:hypothetical protein